jgi:hypothetical protein
VHVLHNDSSKIQKENRLITSYVIRTSTRFSKQSIPRARRSTYLSNRLISLHESAWPCGVLIAPLFSVILVSQKLILIFSIIAKKLFFFIQLVEMAMAYATLSDQILVND